MSLYLTEAKLIRCPFNKHHQVSEGRYRFHVEKCREQSGSTWIECKYNAAHFVPPKEMEKHLQSCPDFLLEVQKLKKHAFEQGNNAVVPLNQTPMGSRRAFRPWTTNVETPPPPRTQPMTEWSMPNTPQSSTRSSSPSADMPPPLVPIFSYGNQTPEPEYRPLSPISPLGRPLSPIQNERDLPRTRPSTPPRPRQVDFEAINYDPVKNTYKFGHQHYAARGPSFVSTPSSSSSTIDDDRPGPAAETGAIVNPNFSLLKPINWEALNKLETFEPLTKFQVQTLTAGKRKKYHKLLINWQKWKNERDERQNF